MVLEEEVEHSPMDKTKPPQVPEKPVPSSGTTTSSRSSTSAGGREFTSRRDTAIIRILFDTGARLSEVADLLIDDLDVDVDVIHVMGKGRRARAIPFDPKTGQALTRYLRSRETHKHASSTHLWLGTQGPLGGEGIKQMLERRGAAAGITGLHAHRFRHTLARFAPRMSLVIVGEHRMTWQSPRRVADRRGPIDVGHRQCRWSGSHVRSVLSRSPSANVQTTVRTSRNCSGSAMSRFCLRRQDIHLGWASSA